MSEPKLLQLHIEELRVLGLGPGSLARRSNLPLPKQRQLEVGTSAWVLRALNSIVTGAGAGRA
jgi:hypothetical protein